MLRSGPDSVNGCDTGDLGGPLRGRECETLEFDTPRGSGSLQTCFAITDTASEEHPVADRAQLTLGDISGPNDTDIAIDGVAMRKRALLIAVANASQYGNNARIAPVASLQDGTL